MSAGSALDGPPAAAGFLRSVMTVMAVTLVSGFVVQLAAGRSSFHAPLIVHMHAVAFMGWVAITLAQVWLASSGRIALHRSLGRAALAYVLLLLVLGPMVTLAAVQTARVPFFFQPQHFLIADIATLVGFGGLLAAAVVLRRQTEWHARLQMGAFAMLLGPGFGRLLPMPLLAPYAFEIAASMALLFLAAGIVWDVRTNRRVHPAWWWSISTLAATLVLARLIAFSPMGDAIYAAAISGVAGANPDGLAFPPPPPGVPGP